MPTFTPPIECRTSEKVAERYRLIREATESLASPLSGEDQTVQSMPDVSPTKWHRAHMTWFFETFLLIDHLPRYTEFDPAYRFIFNSYYESVGARHPRTQRGLLSRPGIAEVGQYRRHVDLAMGAFFDRELGGDLAELVELGLNHEQQHQELILMDIKHVLSVNPLRPIYRRESRPEPASEKRLGWIEHEGGNTDIGHAGPSFAFDNEQPRHCVFLRPFALADRPVSCGEWLAFMDDGGYHRPELWLSEGWSAIQAEGQETPLYWFEDSGTWQIFTLFGSRSVDPAEPVCHVSYFEADAFARWAGARLPTESEWEAGARRYFAEMAPHRDTLHPRASTPDGAHIGLGEVWEWTSSAYLPYPGFRVAPGAVGEYNGKFMVNQHVLRGGCCVTPTGHVRATYRNFFPPSARWAFSGTRLAQDL